MLNRNGYGNSNPSGADILREELNSQRNRVGMDEPDSFGGALKESRGKIIENFEEWIKLATDNKINSKNSWNFALIDYFHDLNVIRDGDSINFQKASATLDGCVKIYSSRVDSIATETGRLLSGLATNHHDGDDDEEDENSNGLDGGGSPNGDGPISNEHGTKRKKKNIKQESTLVTNFHALKIRKLEQELAIDPLFKKALAEFDEGGAKSLLLNTLFINSSGRVVFDTTTNSDHMEVDERELSGIVPGLKKEDNKHLDLSVKAPKLDLSGLKRMAYDSWDNTEEITLCPSLKQLKEVLNDINKAKTVLQDVNQTLSNDETKNDDLASDYEQQFDLGVDDNFSDLDSNAADIVFNEGLDHHGAIEDDLPPNSSESPAVQEEDEVNQVADKDLMAYFDQSLKSNWSGPEHWRVKAIKKKRAPASDGSKSPTPSVAKGKKSSKDEFTIDFMSKQELDEDKLFQAPKTLGQVQLKESVMEDSSNKNILPEDLQYNSSRLANFFLKPNRQMRAFKRRASVVIITSNGSDIADENFFSQGYENDIEVISGRSDPTFFEDTPMDDDSFDLSVAFDNFDNFETEGSPLPIVKDEIEIKEEPQEAGNIWVTESRKIRPEYVKFSRTAKKVDVKVLKDNIWKSISQQDRKPPGSDSEEQANVKPEIKTFKGVVKDIGKYYGADQKKDLSTSFCFICLLHLANEHDLEITETNDLEDLDIKGF